MEDWEGLAKGLGYKEEKEMFLDLYGRQGLSIARISQKLGYGTATIARRMACCKINRRSRGGPNNLSRQSRKLHRMDQRFVLYGPMIEVARAARAHVSTVYKYRKGVIKTDAIRDNQPDKGASPVFDTK